MYTVLLTAPMPGGVSIKPERIVSTTGTIDTTKECAVSNHGGGSGPNHGSRTTYHYCTALLHPRRSHNKAQMAPVNDVQVLMLVKQAAKHHGLIRPHCVHHSVQ
jgi:hypothetical protein